MKILYVAFKYDYADKKRGHSYEHFNFWDTLLAIYGKDIIYFPMDEKTMELGRSGMNKALLDLVEKEKPDILFTSLFTNEIKPKTIKKITKDSNTITINWFSDDQWRFDNFSRYWAPLYDWVVTTDEKALPKYKKIRYDRVIKSTWAANPNIYKPVNSSHEYGVTFVGSANGIRKKNVEELRKLGIKVDCWGSGWEGGRASQEKMTEIFTNSKINLNFAQVSTSARDFKTLLKAFAKIFLRRGTNDTYHFFPSSIILRNLFRFSLPKVGPQIKGRNFEVPACGGFILTQDAENLSDYYVFGEEIVVFDTIDEAAEKIRYYLRSGEERKAIAKAGYNRTTAEHTWEKRFEDIFRTVQKHGKRKS